MKDPIIEIIIECIIGEYNYQDVPLTQNDLDRIRFSVTETVDKYLFTINYN